MDEDLWMLMQKQDYIRTSYLSVFSVQTLESKSVLCAGLRRKILFQNEENLTKWHVEF